MPTNNLSVPEEAVPYLHRIPSESYSKYLAEKHRAEQASKQTNFASKILHFPGFENFMGFVIILNMVVMILEIDASAAATASGASGESNSSMEWTEMFGNIALVLFSCELGLRLYSFRRAFFKDYFNVFDFIIVLTDVVFWLIGHVLGQSFSVSILRIFRLAKLARVSKVLRVFPELRLLLAGLISSLSAIFWGTVLLCLCLLVWAMVAVLFIDPLNSKIDYGDCERCSRAYSSVMAACLTFWQQIVTGDSWGQATIPLIEKEPLTAFFFIPMFLSIGMAVINLILGVVVSVAQESKEQLEEEDKVEKAFKKLTKQSVLLQICEEMDTECAGTLKHSDILGGFKAPGPFRDIILSLDITEDDFAIILQILDPDNTGEVSYKDLVSHLCTLKSSDTEFVLAYMKYYITWIRKTLLQQLQQHQEEVKAFMEMKNDFNEGLESIKECETELMEIEKRKSEIELNSLRQEDCIEAGEKDGLELEKHRSGIGLFSLKPEEPTTSELDARSSLIGSVQEFSSGILRGVQTVAHTINDKTSAQYDDHKTVCVGDLRDGFERLRIELKELFADLKFDMQCRELGSQADSGSRKQVTLIRQVQPESGSIKQDAFSTHGLQLPAVSASGNGTRRATDVNKQLIRL